MSYRDEIIAAPKPEGQFIVIAGPEGIGKTNLLKDAPKRLFIPTEKGGAVAHALPLVETWEKLNSLVDDFTADAMQGKFEFSSISWDSTTAMERLLFDWAVRSDPTYARNPKLSMVTAHGGYGKAYGIAFEEFAKFLAKLDKLGKVWRYQSSIFVPHIC